MVFMVPLSSICLRIVILAVGPASSMCRLIVPFRSDRLFCLQVVDVSSQMIGWLVLLRVSHPVVIAQLGLRVEGSYRAYGSVRLNASTRPSRASGKLLAKIVPKSRGVPFGYKVLWWGGGGHSPVNRNRGEGLGKKGGY